MTISVTRTSVEHVTYTRDEAIGLLLSDEDFIEHTPDESRRLWGELSDVELAYHLGMRLNEGGDAQESVVRDIGEKGTDHEQWTVNGWTGDEPTAMLREAMAATQGCPPMDTPKTHEEKEIQQ